MALLGAVAETVVAQLGRIDVGEIGPLEIGDRKLAEDVRKVLLNAVHSRVEANRLAMQLDAAMETMQHGLCMLDESGLITVANDHAKDEFTALAPGSWVDRPFAALISAASARGTIPQHTAAHLLQMVVAGEGGKVILKLADGRNSEVTVSSQQGRTVLLFEDISERVKAEERIHFMAHYDALTGLPNRAHFTDQAEADLGRRRQLAGDGPAMLMIVDIDDFKHVNDTLGHLIGDRVLIEASERLAGVLARDCLVARLGGDEFIVYRGSGVTEAVVAQVTEAVLDAFKAPFSIMGEMFATNVSLGVATSGSAQENLDSLMTMADLALYKAKANGKAQAQLFRNEMDVEFRYRQRLRADLKQCVAAGELSLVYQPIIDIRTRRVVSCEALARWHHPKWGHVPPHEFIPIAERSGLIVALGERVLREACRQSKVWEAQTGQGVVVAVNVSAMQFAHPGFFRTVEAALEDHAMLPELLEIELTEGIVMHGVDRVTETLERLQRLGVRIAIDDFGTGYSSMAYLPRLPIDKLKIDMAFVQAVPGEGEAIANAILAMARAFGLTVLAEGVETAAQRDFFRAAGCQQLQGYFFGRALPADAFAAQWLEPLAAQRDPGAATATAGASAPGQPVAFIGQAPAGGGARSGPNRPSTSQG